MDRIQANVIMNKIVEVNGLDLYSIDTNKVVMKKDGSVQMSITISRGEIPTKDVIDSIKQNVIDLIPTAKIRMNNTLETYHGQYTMSVKF